MKYWAAFAIINLCSVISMYFISNVKINLKDKKMYCSYLLSTIFLIINFEISLNVFKIIINCLLYVVLARYLINKDLKNSCILGIIVIFINIFSELIFTLFALSFLKPVLFVDSAPYIVLIQNTIIGIITVLLSLIFKKCNFYEIVLKKFNKIGVKQIIIFSLFMVVLFNFFLFLTCFISEGLFNNPILLGVGSSISLFSVALVYSYLTTNNKYVEVMEKYSVSLDSIKLYEDIIENNRVNNHEVRNQFLMLRGMSKNKKLNTYIDSILDKNISTNEDLLNKVIKIPSGGLRGLIYTKLIQMQDNNINYEIYVDKRVNSRKFSKIDSNTMIDICKIIGVFIDNAIECVSNLKKKNITIEIYVERNDVVVCITNNFEGKINLDKFGTVNYTTKGNGRGYGLRLVKEILSQNNRLKNSRELYEDNFTQNLKIKM